MQSRGSNQRLSAMLSGSRPSTLLFAMFSIVAAIYVAGRLWQDAQNRIYLIKELDRITGQGKSAISVADSLKIIACKEQQKKLAALEMELAAARHEGFVTKPSSRASGTGLKKRPLVVIGIHTSFGQKRNRDAIRKVWMLTGAALKKMEDEKGIVVRFIIGRSANQGDSLDRAIINENRQTNDFIILNDHVEAPEELPKKTKLFFAHAADNWDAEFYAKVNDDVYVNIDALVTMLEAHLQVSRTYIGCMKSGEVFSDVGHKWYESDWWKFGDGKSYFRYASGEMYVISRGLAKFISINRSLIRTYAHDDASVGSWFIGLNVEYVHEPKFCCSSWTSGIVSRSSSNVPFYLSVSSATTYPKGHLAQFW
ncbi:hydroxyproline O-galactosyltransferase HPGT1 isoform X1 [Vitis vinifera]|uniref:hydroxyproline O-galactosyltransferase HPGT1 isoform X1 n=1 Tax=Vitis vinifera TaxID=29760 RepID=UPI00015CCC41|nr:hydroxyproline O-galactosyltransferase HPGT1 isoform X1 [Vitis vinifera]